MVDLSIVNRERLPEGNQNDEIVVTFDEISTGEGAHEIPIVTSRWFDHKPMGTELGCTVSSKNSIVCGWNLSFHPIQALPVANLC